VIDGGTRLLDPP